MSEQLRFLKKVFPTHKEKNGELIVRCPKCGDPRRPNKLKMNINPDKSVFHCWVCELKGRSIPRLLRMVNTQQGQQYARKFGERVDSKEKMITNPDVEMPSDFKLVMSNLHLPEAKRIRYYCRTRGLSDDMIWRYRIGFSPEQQWRMIVPSFNEEGKLNYWTARRVDDNPAYKYINSKAQRSDVIFNEIDVDWSAEEITLVEGPWDLMKCSKINATCLLGSFLSSNYQLFTKLIHYPERIVLALDADAREKQDKIAELLMKYDKEVYFVDPPSDGWDFGDLEPEEVEEAVAKKRKYNSTVLMLRKINTL